MILNIFIGILLGFIIGLVPLLHINTFFYIFLLFPILSYSLIFSNFYFLTAFIISHTISSYVPSCFFGIPTTQNILQTLPIHHYFLKGESKKAIYLCLLGSFYGAIFAILLLPLFYVFFYFFSSFKPLIILFLFSTLLLFLLKEKTLNGFLITIFIIFLCGILGVCTISYNYYLKQPLFVCIFGLFGLPFLLQSIFKKNDYVKQSFSTTLPKLTCKTKMFFSSFFSMFIVIVPSFTISQAILVILKFLKKLTREQYILVYSSITFNITIYALFSALFFNKGRTGFLAVLLIENIIPTTQQVSWVFFLITILVSLCLSISLLLLLLNSFIKFINNFNIKKINIIILLFCLLLIFSISNIMALPFLFLSCTIGFLPHLFNKNKVILMSYLILPILLYYL